MPLAGFSIEEEDEGGSSSSSTSVSSTARSASSVFHFASDGTVAFCENPGTANEQWAVPVDKADLAQRLRRQAESIREQIWDEGGDGGSFAAIEGAIHVAHAAVKQCQRMRSRIGLSKDGAIEGLTAQEHRITEALRQNDLRHQALAAEAKLEHGAAMERLREVNLRLTERLQRGVDETRLQNEAKGRERMLQKRIRDLESEKMGLEMRLKDSQALVENNRRAGTKQRADLKQAQRDLADFETLKARLMELEASIRNRSELADLRSKMEADIERQRRLVRSERARSEAMLARVRKENDARVACLEAAFEALRVEFFDRVGEMPETYVLEPREKGSGSDDEDDD